MRVCETSENVRLKNTREGSGSDSGVRMSLIQARWSCLPCQVRLGPRGVHPERQRLVLTNNRNVITF
jgi:hypothetical protein